MRPDTTTLYLSFICALLWGKKITFDQVQSGLGPPPPPGGTLTDQRLPASKTAVLRMLSKLAKGDRNPKSEMIVQAIRERVNGGKSAPIDLREVILGFVGKDARVTAEVMMVAYFAVAIEYEPTVLTVLDPFFTENEQDYIADEKSLIPETNLTLALNLLKDPLLRVTTRGHLVDKMVRILQGKVLNNHLRYQQMIAVFPESDPDDIPTETPRPFRIR